MMNEVNNSQVTRLALQELTYVPVRTSLTVNAKNRGIYGIGRRVFSPSVCLRLSRTEYLSRWFVFDVTSLTPYPSLFFRGFCNPNLPPLFITTFPTRTTYWSKLEIAESVPIELMHTSV